ncbi:S8 family serine peptidase, partial [bacterium]|nr:S8 family serine peptidase [bacterium]
MNTHHNTRFRLLDRPGRVVRNQSQWALDRVSAPAAWQSTTGGNAPLVAVLDTGIDANHPDLTTNLWINPREIPGNGRDDDGNGVVDDIHGYNAVSQNADIHDGGEHGTHVAGIIAANGAVRGVAYQAKILPIKVFDDNGYTDVESVCRAVDYAQEQGARILNCSWGGAVEFNQALYEKMRDFPGLIVCSAGNSGSDSDAVPHYPSGFDLPNLISVAASSRQDKICFTSCYGASSVDLSAPGEQILSTVPNAGHKVKSGTSQAAPQVAATAALIWSLRPQASPAEVKAHILAGVDPVQQLQGKVASGGRLNVAGALAELKRGGHGPHLLRQFYADIQDERQHALEMDNGPQDADSRPGYLDLGDQQVRLFTNGLGIHEKNMMVFLSAEQEGEKLIVDQRGFERDREGCYAYPLHLEGGPDLPFDPPDAVRIPPAEYARAESEWEAGWNFGASLRRV